jgi:heme/copper-type cytochrome/quinol oxidase subunit 2
MNTSALITMVVTQVLVAFFMVYFFVKVLRAPKQAEPDSYYENDDDE